MFPLNTTFFSQLVENVVEMRQNMTAVPKAYSVCCHYMDIPAYLSVLVRYKSSNTYKAVYGEEW